MHISESGAITIFYCLFFVFGRKCRVFLFSFIFRPENEVAFSILFIFRPKKEKLFNGRPLICFRRPQNCEIGGTHCLLEINIGSEI